MIDFFTKQEGDEIIAAIRRAELNSSGEIRVHLEDDCKGEIVHAARKTFKRLGMQKTKEKNGVLFFLAPERKEFAIIGDEGIDEVVPNDFWDEIRDISQQHFRQNDFLEGIIKSIERVGEKLKAYFPYQKDDENELPDEISYG
ncbi:MAG: TPM domain-containing protein [Bacteroidota bacterium]